MRPNAEAALASLLQHSPAARAEWEKTQKLTDDPRVTPLGRILRKKSLDEFPQIFNVIIGQMSLVGPRPVVESELDRYGPYAAIYGSVRPGVTGLWQVSGRNDLSYAERVRMDVEYVSSLSFLRDIWLILRTFIEVVRRSGI